MKSMLHDSPAWRGTGKGCSKNFFSTSWNNDSLHESMGQHANDAGYKKVYLLAPNY